ncbi:DUF799 family lipoprotein [Aerophototrophica crusticola]|uniref:DUF799 family lipoprotein n=1 Tax=Aerophototrophica crusticola TaxID=1709002 RepID=A0A858R9B7_9PROT|nr:DUF799 family lipoprotein [Rhodospirillaceae bacterium B3]
MRLFARAALAAIALLGLSACATPPEVQKKDYTAFKASHPRSILVVPVTNKSTQVDAPDNFLTTLPVPLAERGYYVFPVHMVKRTMEDEGLGDADMVHGADVKRLAALFGADAVLYANIERWESAYAILATTTTVAITYTLKSGKTGETLWEEKVQTTYSPQAQSSGGGLLGQLLAQAVVAAMERASPSYLPLAYQANGIALYGPGKYIPKGPYDPEHTKDY